MIPAISGEIARAVAEVGSADMMVAIPAYNNELTIAHVMKVAAEGLSTFFADRKCVIFVCEGGSLDETKNVALMTDVGLTVCKMVGTYRGDSGKGSALRAIFKAALDLGVASCALIDGDNRNLTPDWVNNMLTPIAREGFGAADRGQGAGACDGVVPLYVGGLRSNPVCREAGVDGGHLGQP